MSPKRTAADKYKTNVIKVLVMFFKISTNLLTKKSGNRGHRQNKRVLSVVSGIILHVIVPVNSKLTFHITHGLEQI